MLGVQPLLYAAYIHAGAISDARLGLLAAVEINAIAFGSMAGIQLLRAKSARVICMIGLLLLIVGRRLPRRRRCHGCGGNLALTINTDHSVGPVMNSLPALAPRNTSST